MAQRRPITDHPAFAPLLAVWFAALFGLGLAVLPRFLIERALSNMGGDALIPLTLASRVGLSAVAALLGAMVGLVLGRQLGRRLSVDPRPLYEELEAARTGDEVEEPVRRPLRVREEVDEAPGGAYTDAGEASLEPGHETIADPPQAFADTVDDSFMILGPQPAHPPRPAPDLTALLAQFDHALDTFRARDEPAAPVGVERPDPVQAFVARQTGTPAPGHVLAKLDDAMPDHQAELRAALDKLAEAQRRDEG